MLSTENLTLPGYAEKFKPKFVGPYVIKRVISPVVYELDMPDSFRKFNKFHISLLKPFTE